MKILCHHFFLHIKKLFYSIRFILIQKRAREGTFGCLQTPTGAVETEKGSKTSGNRARLGRPPSDTCEQVFQLTCRPPAVLSETPLISLTPPGSARHSYPFLPEPPRDPCHLAWRPSSVPRTLRSTWALVSTLSSHVRVKCTLNAAVGAAMASRCPSILR